MNDAALLDSLHAALRNPDRSGRTREPYSRTGP